MDPKSPETQTPDLIKVTLPAKRRFIPNSAGSPGVDDRNFVVWRWVFLCALTSLATLLFMWVRGGLFMDFVDYPCRAGFVGIVYTVTTIFLLFGSPFFFRRLRGLAVLAWLTAILAAVWSALPVF